MKILVTGGAGFIGSHFVRQTLKNHPSYRVINLDALTYAGKKENLEGTESPNHVFVKGNICDEPLVSRLFAENDFDAVVNFAAESHVDKSIKGPRVFVETNTMGVLNLLDCAVRAWSKKADWKTKRRFVQISTDEVYGSLPENRPDLKFTEQSPLAPSSPYSASKAGGDLLALSYFHTYGMPVLITRSSNNYGPHQDAEKLIPQMIAQFVQDKSCRVYGDGRNVRDWLHVFDHCDAVDLVLHQGKPGEVYNVGANCEKENRDLVARILAHLGAKTAADHIRPVEDRPGHDRRYAIDAAKIRKLGWAPKINFEDGLKETVKWYERRLARA